MFRMSGNLVEQKCNPQHATSGEVSTEQELTRVEAAYSKRKDVSRYTMFEPAVLLAVQELERKLLAAFRRKGMKSFEQLQILEVGCGTGFWIRQFIEWGALPEHIHGLDLIPERIAEAKRLCSSGVTLECGSATQLRHDSGKFDLVFQFTMFTSILDFQVKEQVAREMLRVLRPHGSIIWYDFHVNNPHNRDVRGIGIEELGALFPECRVECHRTTLAPPIARPVARISPALHRYLSIISLLRTHYLALITRL